MIPYNSNNLETKNIASHHIIYLSSDLWESIVIVTQVSDFIGTEPG